MNFDAGSLLFKIQTVGKQIFERDLADTQRAMDRTGQAATKAAAQGKQLGTATDEVGKKARQAKAPLTEQAQVTESLAQKTARLKKEQVEQARAAAAQIDAAKRLSAGLMLTGVAVAAVVGLSVAKFTQFDQAMSNTAAAVMATRQEQEKLSESALKAGADTAYSATEAANAQEELAKAGLTVSEIVGGSLNGALGLAAAGQLEVARSAEIMATTLKQFELPAKNAGRVSDVLAAGAGKAQGSVEDLSLALSYVGPLANTAGWSLEETAGTLSYFATQGILGEKAGTALRGTLAALQSPSAIAKRTMDEYGLSIYDASGKMLSADAVAGNLASAFGGLTDEERNAALGRIFGNESLLAATLLYEGGAEAVAKMTDEVTDYGYSTEQAAMRQDNLAGDVEKLGGAFDTALIKSGSGANDVLRTMVQTLEEAVDWYGELPAPVQSTAIVLATATAAALLFSGAAIGLRVKYTELKASLDATNASMSKTALIGGLVGVALTGAITVVAILAQKQAEARQRAEDYAAALQAGADAGETMVTNLQKVDTGILGLQNFGSAADAAETLGLSFETVRAAIEGAPEAVEELDAAIQASKDGFNQWTGEGKEARNAAIVLEESVRRESAALQEGERLTKQAAKATKENAESSEDAADSSQTAAEAYLANADAAAELEGELSKLIDTLMEANGENQDAISANAKWRESLDGISEDVEAQKDAYNEANDTLDGFNLSLDRNTTAGAVNAATLADVASAAQDAAQQQREADMNTMSAKAATDKYNSTLAAQRTAFEKSAVAAGYNAGEVKALADEVFGIPDEKSVDLTADTTRALDAIDNLIWQISQRRAVIMVDQRPGTVVRPGQIGITEANGGVVSFHANGSTRENHVAQIAKAGEWRVWAEDETGGEAYIPLAASKRSRSEDIMAKTASILGGKYLPSSMTAFAGGGLSFAGAQHSVWREEKRVRAAEAKARRTGTKEAKEALADRKRDLADAKAELADIRRSFNSERLEYYTENRRGENRAAGMGGNGLSLVDRLADVGRDLGGKRGSWVLKEAQRSEKQYLKLERAADGAATKLDRAKDTLAGLSDAAKSMSERVSSSIRSFFNIGDVASAKTKTETVGTQKTLNVGGTSYGWSETAERTTTTKATSKSILAETRAKAHQMQAFAKQLKALAKKGFNGVLLEEVAGLGVENGAPVAAALLTATESEVRSMNAAYKHLDVVSNAGGKAVADANFAAMIKDAEKTRAAAQKNSDAIQKQLKTETDRILRKLDGALRAGAGVKKASGGRISGPGTATSDSVPIMASNDEHMWDVAAVHGIPGGHATLDKMRADARAGKFVYPGFRDGGRVEAFKGSSNTFTRPAGSQSADLERFAGRLEVAVARVETAVIASRRANVTFVNPVTRDPLTQLRNELDEIGI